MVYKEWDRTEIKPTILKVSSHLTKEQLRTIPYPVEFVWANEAADMAAKTTAAVGRPIDPGWHRFLLIPVTNENIAALSWRLASVIPTGPRSWPRGVRSKKDVTPAISFPAHHASSVESVF